MERDTSSWLINLLLVLILALGGGYWYSLSSYSKVAEIWKQTLREDCTNRMSEISVRKKHMLSPKNSSDIKIVTESQTMQFKKDTTVNLAADEGDYLADQIYLSIKNPVKIEKVDSLFRFKLKENGFDFKTAVSLYHSESEKTTLYGINDVTLLSDYMECTYKFDLKDNIIMKGYAQGGLLLMLLYGKGFYILLSISALFLLAILILVSKKRSYLKSLKQNAFENENAQPDLDSSETANTLILDEKKHIVVCADKSILLTPKVFNLFYQLTQGRDYFQSYDYLFQTLWTKEENADKKQLEQLVIRLRKDLKDITWLKIDTIRGTGYQIIGDDDVMINFNMIESSDESDVDLIG